jgi:hypothetical protein
VSSIIASNQKKFIGEKIGYANEHSRLFSCPLPKTNLLQAVKSPVRPGPGNASKMEINESVLRKYLWPY